MISSMNIGGVEKSLISFLSVIPKEKYDITILTLEKKGGFKDIKSIIMESPQNTVKRYLIEGNIFKIPSFVYSYYKSKNTNDRYIYNECNTINEVNKLYKEI